MRSDGQTAAGGVSIERLASGEELEFARAGLRHFHEDTTGDGAQRWVPTLAGDDMRLWVGRAARGIVANLGVYATSLSLPGGTLLPNAGVTFVGVSQTHRRRGLLRQLMTSCLDEAVELGEPVASLYASEGAIYGRFGFGQSSPHVRYRLDRGRTRFRDPVDPALVEDADPDEALETFPPILEEVARHRPSVGSAAERWRLALVEDPPDERGGASGRRLVQVPGRGYATYRVVSGDDDGVPAGTVRVESLVASDAEADAALWQHVSDVDLTRSIEVGLRPPDDALPQLLLDATQAHVAGDAAVYTRLLDVPRAMTSRRYLDVGEVVLSVHDPMGYAEGTYRLRVDPDGASCERTEAGPDEADLVLPVDVLSTVWLGAVRTTQLLDARRLEERRPGAAARFDRMVAVERCPWTPFEF